MARTSYPGMKKRTDLKIQRMTYEDMMREKVFVKKQGKKKMQIFDSEWRELQTAMI